MVSERVIFLLLFVDCPYFLLHLFVHISINNVPDGLKSCMSVTFVEREVCPRF